MSKQDLSPSSAAATSAQSQPAYRIGDLVWCQEARNNKLWWPAMVTYDPHLGIFYRTTKMKCVQYHVQYFGISAIRGWVSLKSCVPLVSAKEKAFSEKGLSKKVKSEYEVAIQEVSEAAKLDYKQRKLKFIFSFGQSSRRGKRGKPKPVSSNAVLPVKVEDSDSNSDSISSEATPRDSNVVGSKRTKSGGGVADSKAALVDPLPNGNVDGFGPALRSRVKARGDSLSSTSDEKSSLKASGTSVTSRKSLPDKECSSHTKAKKLATLSANGQWGARKGAKAADIPISPLCLHSQHFSRPSTRRRSSDSSYHDCEQCMEYINNSDAIDMKCTSEPEVFLDDSHLETEAKPILMYVQKQYGSSETQLPSKANALPNLNHNPLTKGVSTRNVSTSLLSGTAKQSLHRATHLKGLERGRKSSDSPSPILPIDHSSSVGSLNSESGYETGKNVQHPSSASRKRKKRTNLSCSSMPSIVSPLAEVQSKQPSDEMEEEPVSKKRKRTRNLSSSSVPIEVQVSDKDAGSNEEGSSPVKRIRKANLKYTEPMGTKRTRRNSAPLKKSFPDSISPAVTPSISANDSGNESSTASVTTPILTLPTSSSEEAPSVDFRSDSEGQASSKEKKRPPKQAPGADIDSKRVVCSICDCDGADLACTGHCMCSFHLDCLGIVEQPSFKFLCDECLISSETCFICGSGHGEVRKCSRPRCSKLYHQECIRGNDLFQKGKSASFTCPLHVCARCVSIGVSTIEHTNLLQCVKCPLALHKPDCLVAGCEVIDHTHMLCYQHLKITKNTKLYSHTNINTCLECGSIGSLYCCDVCSAAYHSECLDHDARPGSDTNHWKCPSCAVHDLPVYGSLVITKFGVWRWWPSEVVQPEDIPDNILAKKPGDCMFVVRFCGSRDFCWTYHGRVLPYTDETELDGRRGHHKKPKATDNYKKACEEAREIKNNRRKMLEVKEAARQNSKFYTKTKMNKYLVPRPPLDLESPEFMPCQCTPENPCKEDSTCVNRAIHSECNPKNCPVGELCQNQRMQKCQNARTELFLTGNRGWGLKAATDLNVGDFVIEYVGEVLDEAMCRERLKKAHSQNNNNFYMLTLDAGLVIDAGCKSNQARFINHSCSPNCETQKWRARGEPRIGIFARESIKAGRELTFDYHLDSLGNEKKKCFCGSKNCSGFMGLRSSKVTEDDAKVKAKPKKKKKPKPRQPVKKEEDKEEEEDRHDDECFVCKDGGELLLCDRKSCCRAYHLECISRKIIPPKSIKWECPWHFCSKCQKAAVSFCATCPMSFCSKDLKNNLFKPEEDSNILHCESCLDHAKSAGGNVCGADLSNEETKLDSSVVTVSQPGSLQNPTQGKKEDQKDKAGSKKLFRPIDPAATQLSPKADLSSPPRLSPPLVGSVPMPKKSRPPSGADAQQGLDPSSDSRKNPDLHVRSPRAHISPTPTTSASEYHTKDTETQGAVLQCVPDAHRSPSAFRTCLATNRPPLFQPQSPTFGQNYSIPMPESHSAKLPDGYVDFSGARVAATSGFQPAQQSPSFINPVWFMQRNGLMNGLDPAAAAAAGAGFGYPSYPSALINHAPIGFPYPPGYFGDPTIPNLESFNIGMHHQLPSAPSSSGPAPTTAVAAPTSSSFPAVFSPAAHQQNAFLAWKYC